MAGSVERISLSRSSPLISGETCTAQFFFDRRDQQHVRRFGVQFKIIRHALAADNRRKRPERFAELHFQIHHRLHFGRTRVAENRAVAERARAEFHPALKPADDFFRFQKFDGEIQQRIRFQFLKNGVVRSAAPFQFRRRKIRGRAARLALNRWERQPRGFSVCAYHAASAAPSAPPASPAAG